jgi:hypothetical protein
VHDANSIPEPGLGAWWANRFLSAAARRSAAGNENLLPIPSSFTTSAGRAAKSSRAGGLRVDAAFRDVLQNLVCVCVLLQCLLEDRRDIVAANAMGKRPRRVVAGHLMARASIRPTADRLARVGSRSPTVPSDWPVTRARSASKAATTASPTGSAAELILQQCGSTRLVTGSLGRSHPMRGFTRSDKRPPGSCSRPHTAAASW